MFQISQENNYQTAVLPRLNGQNKRIGEGNRNSGLYSAAVPAAVAGPASATKDKDPHHLQQGKPPAIKTGTIPAGRANQGKPPTIIKTGSTPAAGQNTGQRAYNVKQ